MKKPAAFVLLLAYVAPSLAHPSNLGPNCDKAQRLANGQGAVIMGNQAQQGQTLNAMKVNLSTGGTWTIDGPTYTYTPGEYIRLSSSITGHEYGIYTTTGTLTGAGDCEGKLATDATSITLQGGTATIVAMSAPGYGVVTYQTLILSRRPHLRRHHRHRTVATTLSLTLALTLINTPTITLATHCTVATRISPLTGGCSQYVDTDQCTCAKEARR